MKKELFPDNDNRDGSGNDPSEHWVGMPDFEQERQRPFSQVTIRFEDEEAMNSFAELIGQKLTPKTKSLWFPERGKSDVGLFRWK